MLKKANFKLIFDILFFIVAMNALATLIIILVQGFDVSFSNLMFKPNKSASSSLYIGVINEIIFSVAFVFVAFHLRKVAKLFIINGEFKSLKLVKHLKLSGQFLVILGLSSVIKKVFLLYYFEYTQHFFQTNSMIYLLLIVVGFSFIRLSKMLQLSIKAKQEQDLTI